LVFDGREVLWCIVVRYLRILMDYCVWMGMCSKRGITLIGIKAAAETLPFPDSSYDAIVSTKVLCTVQDQVQAFREIHRVLRPGGRFVFVEHVSLRQADGVLVVVVVVVIVIMM